MDKLALKVLVLALSFQCVLILNLKAQSITNEIDCTFNGHGIDRLEVGKISSDFLSTARIEPLVVRKEVDTFKLMLGVKDSTVLSVEVDFSSNIIPNSVALFDDGTHGDQVAGDKIFTAEGLAPVVNDVRAVSNAVLRGNFTFSHADGSEVSSEEFLPIRVRIIDPNIVSIPGVTELASDVHASEYVMSIVMPEVYGDYPAQFFGDSRVNPTIPGRAPFMRYYDFFPDDRDFLMVASLINFDSASGSFGDISNDVEGIGISMHNSASSWNSSGRLTGVIQIGHATDWFQVYNHEILHNWAVKLDTSLGFRLRSTHWSGLNSSSTCFGENSSNNFTFPSIEHESDSTYAVSRNGLSSVCNELELYLMGLIGSEEIDISFPTLVNPERITSTLYRADSLREVSIEEIISVSGPRIPNVADSQKEFSLAYIIPYERLLNPIEFAYFDYLMREYEKTNSEHREPSFESATGGRATIKTRLDSNVISDIEIERTDDGVPMTFALQQNYPNPFNPVTTITFDIPQRSNINLKIYDVLGRRVAVLASGSYPAGRFQAVWDARSFSSGVYVYRLETEQGTTARKMILAN